jgi:hypothetical protein
VHSACAARSAGHCATCMCPVPAAVHWSAYRLRPPCSCRCLCCSGAGCSPCWPGPAWGRCSVSVLAHWARPPAAGSIASRHMHAERLPAHTCQMPFPAHWPDRLCFHAWDCLQPSLLPSLPSWKAHPLSGAPGSEPSSCLAGCAASRMDRRGCGERSSWLVGGRGQACRLTCWVVTVCPARWARWLADLPCGPPPYLPAGSMSCSGWPASTVCMQRRQMSSRCVL